MPLSLSLREAYTLEDRDYLHKGEAIEREKKAALKPRTPDEPAPLLRTAPCS